jgi:tRNA(Arg) A34 adenosine deaminase TadA
LHCTDEPLQMCAGTIYWAGIGGLCYAGQEDALREMTGDHPENPTLALPCRAVLETGARPTTVVGPVPELAEEVLAPHRTFWIERPRQ